MILKDVLLGAENISKIMHRGQLVYEYNKLPNPTMTGLSLWLDFKDRNNADANRSKLLDLSGNNNIGNLYDFAYEAGSGYETGLRFDSVDDYGLVNMSPSLNPTDQLTMEILFTADSVTTKQHIIGRLGVTYALMLDPSGRIYLHVHETEYPYVYSNSVLKPDTLYHIIAEFSGIEKEWRIWINGVLDAQGTTSGTIRDAGSDIYGFTIAQYDWAQFPYSGEIYSMRMYKHYLNDAEVMHNFNREKERWNL